MSAIGTAQARVGLLGNPSDGYGGRVIAMTLPQFQARAQVKPAANGWTFGGSELLEATVAELQATHPHLVQDPAELSFTTTVPRQVGLAGSSAIIIATLRALAERANSPWDRVDLARTALQIETDQLGWSAGPQDRVVQAYEGLVDMDFAQPWHDDGYVSLDESLLPPLFVAWNQTMGEPSTVEHARVRERWLAGDQQVTSTMSEFADLAVQGRAALDHRTAAQVWPDLIDQAFDLRSAIWNITEIDTALVETGRSFDAGVAFAGSGGAVIGCPRNPEALADIERAYRELGAGFAEVSS